ncbi:MAG: hypothetical protein K0S61_4888 [Anaerocolumna sp.]|nr:hypothetical protein [Anaerocolumna sp.]
MRKYILICFISLIALALIGCNKKKNEEDIVVTPTVVTNTPTPTVALAPTVEEENHDNEVKSKLTGLWVLKEVG